MRLAPRFTLGTATLIAMSGTPLHAQQENPATSESAVSATDMEEVVVTARRREESLQDVPISVTAVTGSQLQEAGVTDILSMQAVTPALGASTQGTSRNNLGLSLRGQRTNESQLLTDSPVGTYFAEVLQARNNGFALSMYDLASVQVLSGVQGTLFGRNMTGGALLVEPNGPTNDVEGEIRITGGNYDLADVYGMLNLPMGEKAALRIAAKTRQRDGFSTDVSDGRDYDDQNYDSIRVSLKLEPGAGIESTTIYDWLESKTHGPALYPTAVNPAAPAIGGYTYFRSLGYDIADPVAEFAAQESYGRQEFDQGFGDGGTLDAYGFPTSETIRNWGITNRSSMPVGELMVKNIFGYRSLYYENFQDLDGVPAFLINSQQLKDIEQYSNELQLQGELVDGRLTFVTGVYYFLEKGQDGATSQQFPELALASQGLPLDTPAILFRNKTGGTGRAEAYAGYLAGTFELTPQVDLSAGLRYTKDKRKVEVTQSLPQAGVCIFRQSDGTPFPFEDCAQSNHASWDAVTWDVTLQYEPNDALTVYASTRKGFRAGGFSMRAASVEELQPFDPEKVQEYELGLKNRFRFDGAMLSTSAAVFFQDYTNVQKQSSGIDAAGNVTTIIENTAAQENYGGELSAMLSAGPFDFNLSYAYVDVNVTKGRKEGEYELVGAAHHQLGASLGYSRQIGNLGVANANVNASYRGKVYLDKNDVQGEEGGYTLFNLRAGLDEIGGSGFGVAAFVNNLTDEWYRLGVIGIYKEAGYISSTYGEPRMYGMEVSYRF